MSSSSRVECKNCRWYRTSPWEAHATGCYFPANMKAKQSDKYLKEQELPGDASKINLRGDCPDFQAKAPKPSFLERLLRLGA